ncbi:MAG TPA: hypothetical protein VGK59_06020 [Ohtaekwangia sp.]
MPGIHVKVMRFVLLILVIQFFSPVFLTVITPGSSTVESNGPKLHAHHCSIIAPLLLKEKDETETKSSDTVVEFVALIDFTDHSSVLTELHTNKLTPFVFRDRIDHRPPLFTLNSVFLI